MGAGSMNSKSISQTIFRHLQQRDRVIACQEEAAVTDNEKRHSQDENLKRRQIVATKVIERAAKGTVEIIYLH
jgi:hypothetical protein